MKMHHYVLRWRPTSYSIIGPFDTAYAAAEWGRKDQDRDLDDNPCWNTIELLDPHAPPTVITP